MHDTREDGVWLQADHGGVELCAKIWLFRQRCASLLFLWRHSETVLFVAKDSDDI